MYLAHFGLSEPPFGITPDTQFIYAGSSHQSALNTLLVAHQSGEGFIKVTGEVIPMSSKKVRNSPDGQFHWCSVAGKADGKTICLFVPPRAY